MEYTVHELAKMSGVTVRTLHYYDEKGILQPNKRLENGYRLYGEEEVNKLQQILLYRELGFSLQQIKGILENPEYDRIKALISQSEELIRKRNQIEQMIATVQKTICMIEGKDSLSDEEKFIGLKKSVVEMKEKAFGKELRMRYGDDVINASNQKLIQLDNIEWNNLMELEKLIFELLSKAFALGNPKGEVAMKVCELHKEWICRQWKDGTYSKEVHMALVEGYVLDERFKAYYDKIGAGCTIFLRDAMKYYLMERN